MPSKIRKTNKRRIRRNTRSRRIRRNRIKSKKYIGGVQVPDDIVKQVLNEWSMFRTLIINVGYESGEIEYTGHGNYRIGTPILTSVQHEYDPTSEHVIGVVDYGYKGYLVKIIVTKMKPSDTDKNKNPIYYFYNWSDEFMKYDNDHEYKFNKIPVAIGKYQYDETKDKVPYDTEIDETTIGNVVSSGEARNDHLIPNKYYIIRDTRYGEKKDPSYSEKYVPLIDTNNPDDFTKREKINT